MPTTAASAKPPSARSSETQASSSDSGLEKNRTSSRPIFSSDGKQQRAPQAAARRGFPGDEYGANKEERQDAAHTRGLDPLTRGS